MKNDYLYADKIYQISLACPNCSCTLHAWDGDEREIFMETTQCFTCGWFTKNAWTDKGDNYQFRGYRNPRSLNGLRIHNKMKPIRFNPEKTYYGIPGVLEYTSV